MKRLDIYSTLVKLGFKAPDNDNIMFFKGYLFYFIRHIANEEISQKLKERVYLDYTDDQYRKLLTRLKKNGHVL